MEVSGPGPLNGPLPINRPPASQPTEPTSKTGPVTPKDEVEISAVGRSLGEANDTSDVRKARLEQIKAAIDNGTYETQEKFDIAMNRLLESIEHGTT